MTATEVAITFSLHPNVARHHLQRLVDGGYLRVRDRPQGRPAPAGPSKQFFCVEEELTVGLMQRRDDLLMRLARPRPCSGWARRGGEDGAPTSARSTAVVGRPHDPDRGAAHHPGRHARGGRHPRPPTASPPTPRTAARPRPWWPSSAPSATPAPPTRCCAPSTGAWSRDFWPGLRGRASERALPVILSSRARGDAACTASA